MNFVRKAILKEVKVKKIPNNIANIRSFYVPPLSEKDFPKFSERVSGKTENKEDVWMEIEHPRYTKVKEVEGFWHFVERLKPKFQTLNEIGTLTPNKSGSSSADPGEWRPAAHPPPKTPYFVDRTRNNVLPVYFFIEPRGPRQITQLRKIKGDIWSLEKEIRYHLESKYGKEIETQVHEVVGFIKFKGSYLDDLKQWLYQKGF